MKGQKLFDTVAPQPINELCISDHEQQHPYLSVALFNHDLTAMWPQGASLSRKLHCNCNTQANLLYSDESAVSVLRLLSPQALWTLLKLLSKLVANALF